MTRNINKSGCAYVSLRLAKLCNVYRKIFTRTRLSRRTQNKRVRCYEWVDVAIVELAHAAVGVN
jgi:hypothetical protein